MSASCDAYWGLHRFPLQQAYAENSPMPRSCHRRKHILTAAQAKGFIARFACAATRAFSRYAQLCFIMCGGRAFRTPSPSPCFSQVLILKRDKVVCFDTLLQVLILKLFMSHQNCAPLDAPSLFFCDQVCH